MYLKLVTISVRMISAVIFKTYVLLFRIGLLF